MYSKSTYTIQQEIFEAENFQVHLLIIRSFHELNFKGLLGHHCIIYILQ